MWHPSQASIARRPDITSHLNLTGNIDENNHQKVIKDTKTEQNRSRGPAPISPTASLDAVIAANPSPS